MFRLERDLAERMFRRDNGAKVIVATPTLAQGLNLPAQLAVLAGDKRADSKNKGREDLEAHELLNAAARAGRAGHLANGVVLLVPEPVISFTEGENLDYDVIQKLRSILPEDDRCVSITDPLEVVLDRLMSGQLLDRDVKYTLNRMAALNASSEEDAASIFNLDRSLGFYAAKKKNDESTFNEKIETLKSQIELTSTADPDKTLSILASQSGLPADLLNRLRSRIIAQIGGLPTTISGWLSWTIEWLAADAEARGLILEDITGSMLAATGRKKTDPLIVDVLTEVLAGVLAWITGKTIFEIEVILGGSPDTGSATTKHCPRSRELAGTVIPRGMSFILGLVSHVVQQVDPFDKQEGLDNELVELLSTAVRRGFDTPAKLQFALNNKKLIGRVQAHKAWTAQMTFFAGSIGEWNLP
jgi:hypothetical protein